MPAASETVRWGIVSTGAIARTLALALQSAEHATLTAVASRAMDKADAFADEFGAEHRFDDYHKLFASDACDAVYIATPHTSHARLAIHAAEAGKHVFVEKPAGVNRPEVDAAIEAAVTHGVYFAEAFKERRHPVALKLVELLKDRAIGEVRLIRAHFGFGIGPGGDPESRILNPELAGGGILDVGCYAVNLTRLLAGAAAGGEPHFRHPAQSRGVARLGETGVDEVASASMLFDTGVVGEVSTGIRTPGNTGLTVLGDGGAIRCPDPWANDREQGGRFTIEVHRNGADPETLTLDCPVTAFTLEIDAASRDILDGRNEASPPGMTFDDSLSNAGTLDQWRRDVKLSYPCEEPEGFDRPVHGRPLKKRRDAPMAYRRVPGLDKPVARMVMGCDNQVSFAQAAVMFDAWYEAGGNAFDTAHLYGGGLQERLLGRWLASRGVRDDCVIISKGAHTPYCYPHDIDRQLCESQERMGLDRSDIYILHRDNPDVPVGEFVDCLSAHVDAGRITLFGGSNWTLDRIAEANAYAEKHGKHPFSVLSNNFSLARMLEPVWPGCVASSDPESIAWLTEHRMANFAWSSQARGFFAAPDAEPLRTGVNSWDDEGNRERRRRAFELAEKYGVSGINIAAAYVLSQPFPSFALIGPRRLSELRTSLPALAIELSDAERAYLDLRSDDKPA